MYQQDNILNELQELSPTLSEIPRVNVFRVPEGYFDLLSTQLLLQVRAEAPAHVTPEMNASVPQGYFENLADNIMARIRQESLSEVALETHAVSSLVAEIGNRNVFQAPEGYFDGLANSILAKTNSFSNNDVTVETAGISSLVAGIGNRNVFSVPEHYFTSLTQDVMGKLPGSAKVVTMKSRLTAFRYAAAAVVTGLVGLSIFFLLNKNNVDSNNTVQTAAVLTEAKQIMSTNSFDKEFSSVSDDAIVSFLESKGQDVEAALVASLTDEKNLPDADDYIINENTLDQVLKTLDLNN
jgi:hypothetical protein